MSSEPSGAASWWAFQMTNEGQNGISYVVSKYDIVESIPVYSFQFYHSWDLTDYV